MSKKGDAKYNNGINPDIDEEKWQGGGLASTSRDNNLVATNLENNLSDGSAGPRVDSFELNNKEQRSICTRILLLLEKSHNGNRKNIKVKPINIDCKQLAVEENEDVHLSKEDIDLQKGLNKL